MHFTDSDWQDFENLVFSILYDILKMQYDDVKGIQTKARKDGGFDGRFYLAGKDGSLHDAEKNMVFEVKLRNNTRKDLPLSDFSKSIIIAINMAANALTIATNLDFSKKTNELLASFSDKTGLIINELNGNQIRNWLNFNTDFDRDFKNQRLLKFIKNSTTNEDVSIETPFKIIFRESEHKGAFINSNRRYKCKEIVEFIHNTKNSVLLSGEAGVGKSFLIDKILDELTIRNVQCISISLKHADTPRTFFMRVLSNIWHISEEYLLSMESEDLREAICTLGTTEIETSLVDTILCLFEKNTEEMSKKADIFNRSLVLYLKKLLQVCTSRKKIVLSIANINVATKELLDFLCQLTEELIKNIQLILEIRTSEYIDINMQSKDWNMYEKIIKNLSNCIQEFTIEKLVPVESYEYIDFLLAPKKISFETKNKIIQYAGNNPLFLKSFVDYIILSSQFQNNPEELFSSVISSIYVDSKLEIADLLINKLAENNTISMQIFLLLKFFDGTVKENILEEELKISLKDIPSELYESNVIFIVKDEIRTSHLIYQDIIAECHYASYMIKKNLADELFMKAELYEQDPEKLLELKFRLLETTNNVKEMIHIGIQLGQYKYLHGQYTMCAKYIEKCLINLEYIFGDEDYSIMQIQLLEYAINAEFYTKTNIRTTELYIQQLQEIFDSPSDKIMGQKDYGNLYITYLLIMNQYYHHKGDFFKTYETICEAKKFVIEHRNHVSELLSESVWVEYLIAEKEVNGLNAALNEVENALNSCGDSAYLLFTINTLNYSYYCDWNPELAYKNIKNNIDLYAKLAIAEVYHNKVHYLNAKFNLKDSDKNKTLLKDARKLLEETYKFGLKNETGRVENIIGSIYLAEGNLTKAEEYFMYGIKIFADSTYVSNEWPIMANYCSTLFEMQSIKAITYWKKVVDILLEHYKDRINKITFENGKFPKYFAIFYILMNQCNNTFNENTKEFLPYFEKIRQNISLAEIKILLDKIETRTFQMDYEFESSIYVHDGHFIMGY